MTMEPIFHGDEALRNKSDRQKFDYEILLPVWGGEKYWKTLFDISVPSVLASSNLPSASKMASYRFNILTTKRDITPIRELVAQSGLNSVVPVEFIPMDDVLRGASSVACTHAYYRAICRRSPKELGQYFICLTGDLAYSNTFFPTLSELAKKHDAIVSCDFRANRELTEPVLLQRRRNGILDLTSRELVQIGLQHPHPLVAANDVFDNTCHNWRQNQVYWRRGSELIVGKFYLWHPIAFRVTSLPARVPGYFDYSFLPECCPKARPYQVCDSDCFFYLELEEEEHEQDLIRPGAGSEKVLIRCLNEWTTREHRNFSEKTVFFHSVPLDENAQALALLASEKIRAINKKLCRRPRNHLNHPYWRIANATSNRSGSKLGLLSTEIQKILKPYVRAMVGPGLYSQLHRAKKLLLK